MNIKYSEEPFTGYRIKVISANSAQFYPAAGKPYYASYEDAVEVLCACLKAHETSKSFVKFEIVKEEHGKAVKFD